MPANQMLVTESDWQSEFMIAKQKHFGLKQLVTRQS